MICRSCLRNTSRRPCCSRSGAGASTELQRSSRQCTRGRQARRAAERVCAFVEKRMTPAQETSNAVSMLLPTAVLNVWAAPDKLVTIGSAMHLPVSFTYHLSCACSRYSDRIPCCDWTRACSMCLARSSPVWWQCGSEPAQHTSAMASGNVKRRPAVAARPRIDPALHLCFGAAIGPGATTLCQHRLRHCRVCSWLGARLGENALSYRARGLCPRPRRLGQKGLDRNHTSQAPRREPMHKLGKALVVAPAMLRAPEEKLRRLAAVAQRADEGALERRLGGDASEVAFHVVRQNKVGHAAQICDGPSARA